METLADYPDLCAQMRPDNDFGIQPAAISYPIAHLNTLKSRFYGLVMFLWVSHPKYCILNPAQSSRA